jgi:hypothetical protein
MTVTELIAALGDTTPDSQVVVNVGGNQVDEFTVETDAEGLVVLRGQ